MRSRLLLLPAAALAALCALALLLSRRLASDESAPLAGWPAERVVRVELSRGGARLVLEKKAGRWKLLEPLSDWADDRAAAELVDGLEALSIGGAVSSEPSSAASYGLAGLGATRATVFVEGRAAPVLDGSFGSAALGEAGVYFRAERDSEIRLATGLPPRLLARGPEDYRERLLFPRAKGELGRLRLVEFVAPSQAPSFEKPVAVLGPEGEPPVSWRIGPARPEKGGGKPAFRYARCDERGVVGLVAEFDLAPLIAKRK